MHIVFSGFVYFYFICVDLLPLCMLAYHICAMTAQCRDHKVTLESLEL